MINKNLLFIALAIVTLVAGYFIIRNTKATTSATPLPLPLQRSVSAIDAAAKIPANSSDPSHRAPSKPQQEAEASPLPSAKNSTSTTDHQANLATYLRSVSRKGNWEYALGTSGQVNMIGAPMVSGIIGSETKELEFAKNLVGTLGFDKDQVHWESSGKNTVVLVQKYKGYQVHGGLLTLHFRENDKVLHLISNAFKNIGTPATEIKFSKSDTEQALTSIGRVLKIENDPEILSLQKGVGELAWVANVDVGVHKTEKYFVSTATGKIIGKYPLYIVN